MNTKKALFVIGLIALLAGQSFATTYAVTSLEKLVNTSTAVVEATVTETHSAWNADHTSIFTYTTIQVNEVIAGENVPQSLTIRQLGGKVDDKELVIDTRPEFVNGETAVLFIVWHRNQWWINSMGMGKFELQIENGQKIASNSRVSSELLTSRLNNKNSALNYPDFVYSDLKQEIKRLNK